jgi:hypothetical protein
VIGGKLLAQATGSQHARHRLIVDEAIVQFTRRHQCVAIEPSGLDEGRLTALPPGKEDFGLEPDARFEGLQGVKLGAVTGDLTGDGICHRHAIGEIGGSAHRRLI